MTWWLILVFVLIVLAMSAWRVCNIFNDKFDDEDFY